jgi:lipoyl(octanoyl) transferase
MLSHTNKFQYIDWGTIEYNKAWAEQELLFNATIQQKINSEPTHNHFVICEHPHVYTLGKSGDEQNLLLNYIQLQAKNAQFVHSNRGGDITYHGPGQIVGYPIFNLEDFKMGLKQYIHTMEQCIIEVLANHGIPSTRLDGATGVWLDVNTPKARKICAIGVRSSRYVTMHGFALNVNTDLSYFAHINPCGFIDKGVTSMQKELGVEVDIEAVKAQLVAQFSAKFI